MKEYDKKDLENYINWFLAADQMGALLGVKCISLTSQECVYQYEVKPAHFNPLGTLHGGLLYSVMDSSQGMLMHLILDEEFDVAVTGTATIKYLGPSRAGIIRIRTILKERQNRKYFMTSIASDEAGKELAILEGIWIAIDKT